MRKLLGVSTTVLLLLVLNHQASCSTIRKDEQLNSGGDKENGHIANSLPGQTPKALSHAAANIGNNSGYDSGHDSGHGGDHGKEKHNSGGEHHGGVHLISWRWTEFSSAVLFTSMIISTVIIKIIFHHSTWLAKMLPESCVLIVVGVFSAMTIEYIILDDLLEGEHQNPFPEFTANLFFNVLLPPIILDAALALYDKDFFDNVVSIMIFAIFGTLFNVFTIGYSLYGLSYSGLLGDFTVNKTGEPVNHDLGATHCLIFSSLISAVDPVAVLAIFEEINVHMGLYFLVFGESLFNDGVTVVLYNTMNSLLSVPHIGIYESVMAILSFFFVALGGGAIGAINGLFASYITTFTKDVRICEPLVIFSSAYFAFLMAEMVHWSGIISIIGYGITVKRYGFQNLGRESFTTVKYAIKTLASTSDCIIFLFLGIVLISHSHYFHMRFIVATIILCFIFRFLGTFLFSWLVNLRRVHKIEFTEQIIMGYGGLRGAVGFSLAVVLHNDVWYKELFVSAALAMVFFTVFLQGSTIKLLVGCLNIKLGSDDEPLITHDVQESMIDDVMKGVEVIVGNTNKTKGFFAQMCKKFDEGLKKILIVEETKSLMQKYEKIMLDEHFTNLYAPRILANQEDVKAADISVKDSRSIFKKGINNSNWNKFIHHSDSSEPSSLTAIVDQLQMRRERAKSMEVKVLQADEPAQKETATSIAKPDSVERSVSATSSANWAGLKRASMKAVTMKAKYDNIQDEKRSMSPATVRSTRIQDCAAHVPSPLTLRHRVDPIPEDASIHPKESDVLLLKNM